MISSLKNIVTNQMTGSKNIKPKKKSSILSNSHYTTTAA